MGTAAEAGRGQHDNKVWGIEHDGVRYDDLDIIQSILLPEQFYNKEFDILPQQTRYTTVHIEKRQYPKTKKFYYIANSRFYADTDKTRFVSLAIKWISVEEFGRLSSLH